MKYETQLFGGQTNLHCMKQILHNAKSNSHGCIRLAICIATAFAVVMLTAFRRKRHEVVPFER